MTGNLSRAHLLSNLEARKAIADQSRTARLLRHPVRMTLPRIVNAFDMTTIVNTDTFWGGKFRAVLPEAVSTMIYKQGYFDYTVCLSLVEFLPSKGVFVDIGAHFGFFSLLAGELVGNGGKVLAIEAMASTYDELRKNIEANNAHANIETKNIAAFSERSTLRFHDYGAVYSSLNSAFGDRRSNSSGSHVVREIDVQADTADHIISSAGLDRVDVIKVDAESSEVHVIAGLSQTITRFRPVIVIEMSDMNESVRSQCEKVLESLKTSGYSAYKWVNQKLVRTGEALPTTYDNYVFVSD